MRRLPSHPAFKLEGRSRHFQAFWELELTPGEETSPHQHYESEEVIYLVSGNAHVTVARQEKTVQPGEVVLVPPRTDHVIANRSEDLVHALTVESLLDLGDEAGVVTKVPTPEEAQRAVEEAQKSARTIEQLMGDLPKDVDEAVAIRTIVELFDIGGNLSEQIEQTLGLDNATGVSALGHVERKIMQAVVEITSRYRRPERGGGGGGGDRPTSGRFNWG
jgi:mannose-6-phosphate isomerase-like protein (cupin superfamily)